MQLATVRSRRRGRRVSLMDLADLVLVARRQHRRKSCGGFKEKPSPDPRRRLSPEVQPNMRRSARFHRCPLEVLRAFPRSGATSSASNAFFSPPPLGTLPPACRTRRCSRFPGWRTRPTSRSRMAAICSPLRQLRIDKQSRQRTDRRGRIGFCFAVDRVLTSASIDVTDSLTIGGTGAPVRIDGAGHFIRRTSSGFAALDVTIGSNVTIGDFGSGIVGPTAIRLDGVVPTTLRLDGAIVPARLRSSPSGSFSSVDAITASGQATINLSSTGLIQTQLGRSAIVGLPSPTFGSSFGTVVNINGGTIRADGRGIDAPGASVNMTGGLIEAREDALVLGTGSSLSITGGRISGGGDGARFVPLFPAFTTRVAMTGGTLEGVTGNGISTASPCSISPSVQERRSTGRTGIASTGPARRRHHRRHRHGHRRNRDPVRRRERYPDASSDRGHHRQRPRRSRNGPVAARRRLLQRTRRFRRRCRSVRQGSSSASSCSRRPAARPGTLTGSGAQNWTISGGTLQGDTQSLQGNILNNSILAFN